MGFYGEMSRHFAQPELAQATWDHAMSAVSKATGADEMEVQAFLDSRHGRHFIDDVISALRDSAVEQAINRAVTRWMDWRISRSTARETGILRGLPYLTGFVVHAAVEAEAEQLPPHPPSDQTIIGWQA